MTRPPAGPASFETQRQKLKLRQLQREAERAAVVAIWDLARQRRMQRARQLATARPQPENSKASS